MSGLQAFFVGLGTFISSFFFIHKSVPIVKTTSGEKVIFQVAPSTTPNLQSPTLSPTTAPSMSPSQTTISTFVYPNATQTANTGSSITMQTGDPAQAVSSWYQQKISSLGFRATSIVQTNNNGNVVDILDVANNTLEIKIQITRSALDTQTTIVLTAYPTTANTVINKI